MVRHLRARPRMALAAVVGIAVGLLMPDTSGVVTRGLLGWNVGVWLYLALMAAMMWGADHHHLRRVAVAHAEGAGVVLGVGVLATLVSVGAIVLDLSAAKAGGNQPAWQQLAFVFITVVGSWLLLPVLFTLNYASGYFKKHPQNSPNGGLKFPGASEPHPPDYLDFLYFSFTIAVALQTADVVVESREMRRLVLLQALLSFAFNTAVLALAINVAASLF